MLQHPPLRGYYCVAFSVADYCRPLCIPTHAPAQEGRVFAWPIPMCGRPLKRIINKAVAECWLGYFGSGLPYLRFRPPPTLIAPPFPMNPATLYAAFMAEETLAAAKQLWDKPAASPWNAVPGQPGLMLWRVSETHITFGIQQHTEEGTTHLLPVGMFDTGGVVPGVSRIVLDEFVPLDTPPRCKRLGETLNALVGAGSLATKQLATRLFARANKGPVAHTANGHPLMLQGQPFGRVVCLLAYPPMEGDPLPVLEGEPLCTYGFTKSGGWELEPEPQHKMLFETARASGLLSCFPVALAE